MEHSQDVLSMLRTTNSQHGYSHNGSDSFSYGGRGVGFNSTRGEESGREMDADGGLSGRNDMVKHWFKRKEKVARRSNKKTEMVRMGGGGNGSHRHGVHSGVSGDGGYYNQFENLRNDGD